jgi:hypothetical protein
LDLQGLFVDQKQPQRTPPDYTRPGLGTPQLTAAVDRISLGRQTPNPRAKPRLRRWGATALRFGCSCAGLSSFAFLAGASAQNALVPPPLDLPGTGQSPQLQQGGPAGMSVLSAPPVAPLPDLPLWQVGPVKFYPHLLYRFLYGDGIPAQANDRLTTAISEVDPGILFQVGSHWQLDYTPSFLDYSNSHFRNTTDQSVILNGTTAWQSWTLGLSQSYVTTSQPLIETGAQTDLEIYHTAINARYSFNSKASLQIGLSQDFNFVGQNASSEPLVDSKVWSTMDWFNYQVWSRLSAGLGVGGGYVDVSAGSATAFDELQGRVAWQLADKVSLEVSGGVEETRVLDANTPDLISPLFGVSVIYRPFETTSVSLNAGESAMASYIFSQEMENTFITATFHQRLLKALSFGLTAGYQITSYLDSAGGLAQSRQDDYTYVNVRLSVPFLKRGTAGVFYQAGENTSTVSQYQLSSTQVGFDLSYHF